MKEHLFVYGTLKPGHENAALLEKLGGSWQPARIKGHLFPPGWVAAMGGYPGLWPDSSADWVSGFVFSSERLAAFWPEPDDFEGEEYERVLLEVLLEDGTRQEANIYVFREVPPQYRSRLT